VELISFLRAATKLVALTGAGVSQESGLRTFRDAQTGLWAQYKPTELASPEAFHRDPKLVWDWYAWRREAVKGVRPNAGHYALVEIEKRVPQFTLITQNVDNLHRFAGSQNVLELHGNIQRVRCADCYTFTETWDDDTESVPRCRDCGGLLRPDVVWFGESLPRLSSKRRWKQRAHAMSSFRSVHRGWSSLPPRWRLPPITAARWWWSSTPNRRRSRPKRIMFCRANRGRSCRSWSKQFGVLRTWWGVPHTCPPSPLRSGGRCQGRHTPSGAIQKPLHISAGYLWKIFVNVICLALFAEKNLLQWTRP